MSSENASTSKSEAQPVAANPSPAPAPWTVRLRSQLASWALVLGLAMLAGVAAWLVGESTLDYFKPSRTASENTRNPSSLNREMLSVTARNGALTFGVLGGLVGLAMGLAGGLSRQSTQGAVRGAIAGLILGTALGALPSFAIMPWHWRHRTDDPATLSLIAPLLVHLGLWSTIGLGAGLALGIGSGGFKPFHLFEMALAGLVGAMLGTFVYEMVGAFLFPMERTADPFSVTPGTRLLARLCVAGFVGLGAIASLPRQPAPNDRRGG